MKRAAEIAPRVNRSDPNHSPLMMPAAERQIAATTICPAAKASGFPARGASRPTRRIWPAKATAQRTVADSPSVQRSGSLAPCRRKTPARARKTAIHRPRLPLSHRRAVPKIGTMTTLVPVRKADADGLVDLRPSVWSMYPAASSRPGARQRGWTSLRETAAQHGQRNQKPRSHEKPDLQEGKSRHTDDGAMNQGKRGPPDRRHEHQNRDRSEGADGAPLVTRRWQGVRLGRMHPAEQTRRYDARQETVRGRAPGLEDLAPAHARRCHPGQPGTARLARDGSRAETLGVRERSARGDRERQQRSDAACGKTAWP